MEANGRAEREEVGCLGVGWDVAWGSLRWVSRPLRLGEDPLLMPCGVFNSGELDRRRAHRMEMLGGVFFGVGYQ